MCWKYRWVEVFQCFHVNSARTCAKTQGATEQRQKLKRTIQTERRRRRRQRVWQHSSTSAHLTFVYLIPGRARGKRRRRMINIFYALPRLLFYFVIFLFHFPEAPQPTKCTKKKVHARTRRAYKEKKSVCRPTSMPHAITGGQHICCRENQNQIW